jgi:hypothetical protein
MIIPEKLENKTGVVLFSRSLHEAKYEASQLEMICHDIGVSQYTDISVEKYADDFLVNLTVNELIWESNPECDTIQMGRDLSLDSEHSRRDCLIEALLSMAISPIAYIFPNHQELLSNLRMRQDIVATAKRTELLFDGDSSERPKQFWLDDADIGPVLRKDSSLIDALEHALCPDLSGRRYGFSCQRASEYLMLTGLTKELKRSNNSLLSKIEQQWCQAPLKRDNFLHSFLFERGSVHQPFPVRFYVPGSRIWFKNPDNYSSDVGGFEGSWVVYLGSGKFVNLWDRAKPYTLESKCVEIYHWRDGAIRQDSGALVMNEEIVQERVLETLSAPEEHDRILKRMMRYRDPTGVYADGGCIDSTRDSLRWVHPETTNIQICTAYN